MLKNGNSIKTSIKLQNKSFVEGVEIHNVLIHKYDKSIAFQLKLENKDSLFISYPENFNSNDIDYFVQNYINNDENLYYGKATLLFPKVNYHEKITSSDKDSVMNKMLNLVYGAENSPTGHNIWELCEAIQEIIFTMDEIGAEVKMMNAFGGFSGCAIPTYIINKPFTVWMMRKGLSEPYFIREMNESNWTKTDESIKTINYIEKGEVLDA